MKYENSGNKRKSKTKLSKGAFGTLKFLGNYKTLKVLPRHKRTKENCNSHGVSNGN